MNWFKRLCLFVFGLSGMLALVALSLVWVGPWTTQARTLITENHWYFVALEALVCIAAVGLLACVLVALFAPRNPKSTVVAEVDGGKITVTRAAIATQARHVIEADGSCEPVGVSVKVRKRGHVRVHARVRPRLPMDVVERGAILYSELEQGLAKICGESVDKIDLVFTEPAQQGNLSTYVDAKGGSHGKSSRGVGDPFAGEANTTAGQGGQDITVAIAPRVEDAALDKPALGALAFEPVTEEPVADDVAAGGWDAHDVDADWGIERAADATYEEQEATPAEEV